MPLHELSENELEMILEWRNAPSVRHSMHRQHEITMAEHRHWFKELQLDESRRWYIYHDLGGRPQGVVYFTELNPNERTGCWGFYARPGAPAGTGTSMLHEALDLAFSEFRLLALSGEALATNEASIRLHKKLGFTEGECYRDMHQDEDHPVAHVIRFCMRSAEWPEHKYRLRKHLGGGRID